MIRRVAARGALLAPLLATGVHADANLEGHWRWWDQPGPGGRYISRTPSLVFSDSYLLVYFDAAKQCAPFLALAFHPANPDPALPDLVASQQIEVRVDNSPPLLFRSAVSARAGEQLYFVHPLPPTLLESIAAGERLLARSTLAPQIDVFSLRGSAVSIRNQRDLCQLDPGDGEPP